MKIKHFQGYGSINAKKVSSKDYEDACGNPMRKLIVKVWGNHEWGLVREDTYDLFNWLVKRFDKSVERFSQIEAYSYVNDYERVGGIDEEYCIYTFYIRLKSC